MKKMILGLILAAASVSYAGSANTNIKCKTADGKLVIEGYVPGDEMEFNLDIKASGKTYSMFSRINQTTMETEQNASIATIDAIQDSVFTLSSQMTAKNTYGQLSLYALPKTMKAKVRSHERHATFTAKVTFYMGDMLEGIFTKATCETHYSL